MLAILKLITLVGRTGITPGIKLFSYPINGAHNVQAELAPIQPWWSIAL